MQFRQPWSRVIFRPQIFWSLVAIELLLFATAVHSLAARVYRAPHQAVDASDLPATEELAADSAIGTTLAVDAVESLDDAEDLPPGALEWERIFGDYTLRCFAGGFTNEQYVASILEIWQRDTLVYSDASHSFTASDNEPADPTDADAWQSGLPPIGVDLTGRGLPNVVISEYSGGAHCCSTYRIFELGETFREVAVIEAAHGDVDFFDLDGDGIPEIAMRDWSYAYEFTCFASSYAPDIVLRFANDHYVVAPELMTTPSLTEEELVTKAAEVKDAYRAVEEDGHVTLSSPVAWGAGGGELWNAMLELIYGGHEDQALRLFNLAWPEWAHGKRRALRNFTKSVAASDYWQQMAEAQSKQSE